MKSLHLQHRAPFLYSCLTYWCNVDVDNIWVAHSNHILRLKGVHSARQRWHDCLHIPLELIEPLVLRTILLCLLLPTFPTTNSSPLKGASITTVTWPAWHDPVQSFNLINNYLAFFKLVFSVLKMFLSLWILIVFFIASLWIFAFVLHMEEASNQTEKIQGVSPYILSLETQALCDAAGCSAYTGSRWVCSTACAPRAMWYVTEMLKLSARQPRTTAALQCEDPTKTKIVVVQPLSECWQEGGV